MQDMLQLQSTFEFFLTLRSLVLDLYNKANLIYLWNKRMADREIMNLLRYPSVFKSSLIMPQFPIPQFITFFKEEEEPLKLGKFIL